MANKVIGVEIKIIGSDAQRKQLAELDTGLRDLAKSRQDLLKVEKDSQAVLKQVASDRERLTQAQKDGLITLQEYQTENSRLNKIENVAQQSLNKTSSALAQNRTSTIALTIAKGNAEKSIRNTIKAEQAETNSIAALEAKVAQLTEEWRNTDMGTDKFRQLEVDLKKANDQLTDQKAKVGQTGSVFKQFISGIASSGGAFGSAVTGVQGFNSALSANPIGAVVTLLLTLSQSLKGNAEVADLVTRIFAGFNKVVGTLVDAVVNLAKPLGALFEDPIGSVKKFAALVKENIINRFEGLIELVPALGKAIGQLFAGEFKEAGKTAFNAVAKVSTGVEDMSSVVVDGTSKLKNFAGQLYEAGQEGFNAAKKLDEFTVSQQKLNNEIAINEQLVKSLEFQLKDKSKTEQERIAIAKQIADIEIENAGKQVQAAQELLEAEQLKLKGRTLSAEEEARLSKLETDVKIAESEKQITQQQKQTRVNNLLLKEESGARKEISDERLAAELQALQNEDALSQQRLDARKKIIDEEVQQALIGAEKGSNEEKLALAKAEQEKQALQDEFDRAKLENEAANLQEELDNLEEFSAQRVAKELELIDKETQIKLLSVQKGSDAERRLLEDAQEQKDDIILEARAQSVLKQVEALNNETTLLLNAEDERFLKEGGSIREHEAAKLQIRRDAIQKTKALLQTELAEIQTVLQTGLDTDSDGIADKILTEEERAALEARIEQIKQKMSELGLTFEQLGKDAEGKPMGLLERFGLTEDQAVAFTTTAQFIGDTLGQIGNSMNQITDIRLQRIEQEKNAQISAIDAQIAKAEERGQSTEALEKRKLQIEEESARKSEEVRRKAAKRQKVVQIGQAIITSALSALNAYNSLVGIPIVGPALAAVAAGIAAAFGAVQVGIIAATPLKKGGKLQREKGRRGLKVKGSKHGTGSGVDLFDRKTGTFTGQQIEGDELVMTSGVAEDPELLSLASAINQAAGGVSFGGGTKSLKSRRTTARRLQGGGLLSTSSKVGIGVADVDAMLAAISEQTDNKIANIKVRNVATETDDTAKGVRNLEAEFSF